MEIPEGYVLVPREVYDLLVQMAKPMPPTPMPIADLPGGYPGSLYPFTTCHVVQAVHEE